MGLDTASPKRVLPCSKENSSPRGDIPAIRLPVGHRDVVYSNVCAVVSGDAEHVVTVYMDSKVSFIQKAQLRGLCQGIHELILGQ